MKIIAFDTETSLIRPGCTAPPMSCLSYQVQEERSYPSDAVLVHWTDARELVAGWLADPSVILVGHNVAFDLAVVGAEWPELVPLIFQAYEENRIRDTMIRGKLLDIAEGCYRGFYDADEQKFIPLKYSLQDLARRYAGIPIKKEGFRLFYGPLRDVPLEDWPPAAREMQESGRAYLEGDWSRRFGDDLKSLEAALGDSKKFRGPEGLAGMIAADPAEVISYPLDDARVTMAVFLAQEERARELDGVLVSLMNEKVSALADESRQTSSAWWKHLTSAWGLRTRAANVALLQTGTERVCQSIEKQLVEAGLVRTDGSRDTKLAKARMLDVCGWEWDEGLGKYVAIREDALPLRLTSGGQGAPQPSLDADACKATEDELLVAYAELTSLKTVLNKDVPALARATIYPVHTHFDLAETGRTTSSNPNVQNWRRLPGIRECFVPRPGFIFAQADYSGLELCTLAQACIDLLGYSTLGDALNAGIDPHTALACSILGILYDEGIRRKDKSHPLHKEFDDARQTAKVANFGFPGGLGAPKLVLFARKTYGVELTEERARELKAQWLAQWPEMREYFNRVNSLPKVEGPDGKPAFVLKQLRSDRIRGGATYTAACNSFFQGLGADATGYAGWLVARACYVERSSPLFGCRIVNYVHDEFIVEAPEARAAEAAEELSRLMVLGASEWIPDVKLAAEPCLMRVWSKDAKTLRDTNKRLVPWAPQDIAVMAAA